MDNPGHGERDRREVRAAVTPMADPGQRYATEALVADGTVPVERAGRTHGAVVVKREHGRHPSVPARVEDRWADERKGVVNVDDVGPALAQDRRQLATRSGTPDDAARNERLLHGRLPGDVLAETLESGDRVTGRLEHRSLLVDDPIFAADRRSVPVVDEEDLHVRGRAVGAIGGG